MDDQIAQLKTETRVYVDSVHQPIQLFLAAPAGDRDPSVIPTYLHTLDALVGWIDAELKDKIPNQVQRSHLQKSISLRDQVHACYLNLLRNPAPKLERSTLSAAGKPSYLLNINTNLLQELYANGFTDQEMAEHLSCSRQTVIRRRRALGLLDKRAAKHVHAEEEVRRQVALYLAGRDSLTTGQRNVQGWLEANNINTTRDQVRKLMRELDPDGTRLRASVMRKRRVYKVPFPNSLWHIDGQHKLIRWKFVIHGGVDGYSRACVFMHASDNNRAETVEALFLNATEQWGWPQRVRVDYGKENNGIWKQMINIRGTSFSASRPTHS